MEGGELGKDVHDQSLRIVFSYRTFCVVIKAGTLETHTGAEVFRGWCRHILRIKGGRLYRFEPHSQGSRVHTQGTRFAI